MTATRALHTTPVTCPIAARQLAWALFFGVATALVAVPPAAALEKQRSTTVNSGEKVRLWFGANYGRRCHSVGPPVFNLTSNPALGRVTTEESSFTVPVGENCAGMTYVGLALWYQAGALAGTDTFTYTIEFPHDMANPKPSKGPQPVTYTVTVK